MSAHPFISLGKKTTEIPVKISYRIIELFSGGLYSSPNKAIEELVANSFDALASNVHIVLPNDINHSDATIWVVDDGVSMDDAGLKQLWKIASSTKRNPGSESKTRPPIGRFGIGKLATYVLARELTYICKTKKGYRAVTMDFGAIKQDSDTDEELKLDVRNLTEVQAKAALTNLNHSDSPAAKAIPLFGKNASPSWTVTAMTNLKPLAQQITHGRLKWVLSTALPLSPQFNQYFNGERLDSAKEQTKPQQQWIIGKKDAVADSLKLESKDTPPSVIIDGIGPVTGKAEIYEDSLTGGKAEAFGRSHGVFVLVRGRLINVDDALFGIPQLSHGPFVRFRMEIHADGLDAVLRSTREAVLESPGVENLRKYIVAKFNEARAWYTNHLAKSEFEARMTTRVGKTPASLSRTPIINAVKGLLNGAYDSLYLMRVPQGIDQSEKDTIIKRLESDAKSEQGVFKEISLEPLGMDRPLAVFNAETAIVSVNILHPFFANYADHYTSPEPFELIALTEVLTEAYLLEQGMSAQDVRALLERRDRFLRELVYTKQLSATLVAKQLQDAVAHPIGLENAVAEGLRSLGFEVSPIGGKGEPDGVALARLGVRNESTGERGDYQITYDAKSTGADVVQAHTVGAAAIARHRKKYNADYSLVVARGFAGGDDPKCAVVAEARENNITLLAVEDFSRLVLAAATRQLGFTKIKGFFESCRSAEEAKKWIDEVIQTPQDPGLIPEIITTVWEMSKDSNDPIKFAAVKQRSKKLQKYREADIKDWAASARRLAGGYITITGDVIALEAPPEKILNTLRLAAQQLPTGFKEKSTKKQ